MQHSTVLLLPTKLIIDGEWIHSIAQYFLAPPNPHTEAMEWEAGQCLDQSLYLQTLLLSLHSVQLCLQPLLLISTWLNEGISIILISVNIQLLGDGVTG